MTQNTDSAWDACPVCHQYSHSIGEDKLAEAFMHFQSMYSHRGDGIPTQFSFDEKTRDMAQVLVAAARAAPTPAEPSEEEVERVAKALCISCGDVPNREGPWDEWWAESGYARDARAAIAALRAPSGRVEKEVGSDV